MLHPAYEFAADEVAVTTPALDISNVWRASALPIGLGLMTLFAVLRLVSVGDWKLIGSAIALVVVVGGVLYLLSPVLIPLGNFNLLIFFVGLVAVMVLRGGADRVCVWPGDLRLYHADDDNAGDGRGRPNGRRHVAISSCCRCRCSSSSAC